MPQVEMMLREESNMKERIVYDPRKSSKAKSKLKDKNLKPKAK